MEKLNNNPFNPVRNTSAASVLNIIAALVKIPLMLFIFTLSFAYSIIITLIPTDTLKRLASRSTSWLLFKVLLVFTGIFRVNEHPTPLINTYSESSESQTVEPGDIIIANCASYLNLFWLQLMYSPVYVVPCDETNVFIFNIYQMISLILSQRKLSGKIKRPLNYVVEYSKTKLQCPIVLFPEASVTNGKYIISFKKFGNGLNTENTNFHIFGFLHYNSAISPNFTFGNGALHFLLMAGRLLAGMKVKMVLRQDIPKVNEGKIDEEFIKRCRELMSATTNLPLCDADGSLFEEAKKKFLSEKVHEE